ncbi:hypothetical protein H8L32_18630 [Undibacterium sp. CY18W]|uniref:Uncharacterized protein n=1 Tax=Undibacterium hunanense TaxID=2762292 RepID=A0ABR6ZUM4_9BURK|nr:hypothetical protein [Undibacterium hunanense]MBC3919509.1 hypothetical protein [Undibacterium hunanense]
MKTSTTKLYRSILVGILLCLIVFLGAMPAYQYVSKKSISKEVSHLIDELTQSPKRQEAAFLHLESMGTSAVPHIVAHLSDVRPLAERTVRLPNNFPSAREPSRYYEAEQVHEALSALLNQMTNEKFPVFYDGATFQQKMANRDKWVSWCRTHYPDEVSICEGKEGLN